jgi:hypothetical protein
MPTKHPRGSVGRFLKRTLCLMAVSAILGGSVYVYLAYLTPQKLAVRSRLNEADAKSQEAIDMRLKPLSDIFAKGRNGSKAFAEKALSMRGKWELMKGVANGGESHRRYLAELYASLVFSPDELREAMEAAVRAYMGDIEGFESEMLVKLRADLADPVHPGELSQGRLRTDEAFRQEYQRMADLVMVELRLDLGVSVGREVGVMVASTVATEVAMQAARAAATEMGISAGILGTGGASTVATFGIGLVAMYIVDQIVNEVMKLAGYDPEAKIEALVCESIDKLEKALLHDGGTFSSHKKGALRQRMEELHESRSKLRRETITRLLNEGGI